VAEYIRSFFGARIGWAALNGLLIISGAFGVFRRDVLRAVGGLSRDTLGEDMELTMRMHEQLRPTHPETRVAFAPDAVCWTEVPPGLGSLRGQRVRWHIGLLDNLRLHRSMIGRRRFGTVGTLALPYNILFEAVAPILQVSGYVLFTVLAVLSLIAWQYAVAFFVLVLLGAQLQTAASLLIEDVGFGRYRARDLVKVGCWGAAGDVLVPAADRGLARLGHGPVLVGSPARLGDDPARRSARRGARAVAALSAT
jgi:cellulose synthase/poly-beta-1,6-N-acetylglucosamine synthase-like glycosyltransferase